MASKAIVGEKVGMTQIWDDQNRVVPVTVLQVAPCRIVSVKTPERDGYSALQVTFGHKKATKLSKPVAGQFTKAGVEPGPRLVELRLDDVSGYSVGQEIGADIFEAGEVVDAIGTSKGKGFQGTIKRHHFRGGDASHGSMFHRAPGSIGASSYPSRVFLGMRMHGHMGDDRVTVRNLKVLRVDAENNLLLIEGAVPGGPNAVVVIRKAIAAKPIRVAQVEPVKKKGKK